MTIDQLPFTIQQIILRAAHHYAVLVTDVMGKTRMQAVTRARDVAVYQIRALGLHSYPEIGRMFDRDQSSVRLSVRRGKVWVERERSLTDDPGHEDALH